MKTLMNNLLRLFPESAVLCRRLTKGRRRTLAGSSNRGATLWKTNFFQINNFWEQHRDIIMKLNLLAVFSGQSKKTQSVFN